MDMVTPRPDAKSSVRHRKVRRRGRWIAMISWGGLVSSIAMFVGLWQVVKHERTAQAAVAPSQSQSGTPQYRRHRRHDWGATGNGDSGFASGGSQFGSGGADDNGWFGGDGGGVGLGQGSQFDFRSSAS